jgi:hypothetical protein
LHRKAIWKASKENSTRDSVADKQKEQRADKPARKNSKVASWQRRAVKQQTGGRQIAKGQRRGRQIADSRQTNSEVAERGQRRSR